MDSTSQHDKLYMTEVYKTFKDTQNISAFVYRGRVQPLKYFFYVNPAYS